MKKFLSNPIMRCFYVMVCICVFSVPISFVSKEHSLVFSIIVSLLFVGATFYINTIFDKSYSVATLYTRKSMVIFAVTIFVVLEVLAHISDLKFPLYLHLALYYCCVVLFCMIVLMLGSIAKKQEKFYAKRIYIAAKVQLFLFTFVACYATFNVPQEWL